MRDINFQRTYFLGEEFDNIRKKADQILGSYLSDSSLISFNDQESSVTFFSERLIPVSSTSRPRVLLLFSNPHPHSVKQGMFLSPNTKGRKNLFWSVMEDSSWITFKEGNHSLKQLANKCLKADYQGPFELVFYCYYAFPTCYPEEISKIFGKEYFEKVIEPEAKDEFKNTIRELSIKAVVTFNKGIFNLVSEDYIERYIDNLKKGEVIKSKINSIENNISILLTFPTGWRYHKQYMQLRKNNLEAIREKIGREINRKDDIVALPK